MTHKLPPQLLNLFSPRPPLRYLPASDHAPEERITHQISGVAQFLPAIQEYTDTVTPSSGESWFERKERLKFEKRQTETQIGNPAPEKSTLGPFPSTNPARKS